MRKRPWEILLLTFLYAVAPLGNLIFTCYVSGHDITALPYLLLVLSPLEWLSLAVYPILAIAVYSVSIVGWWIFLGLNLALIVSNVYTGSLVPNANLLVLIGANVLNVSVAALLFTPHVRSPYFSPRLRWWNAEVRYRIVYVLDVPLFVTQEEFQGKGLLLDLSLTGCFADLPAGMSMEKPVQLSFECWGLNIQCQGRILRQAGPNESVQGYGIQFLKVTPDQKNHLKALVSTLRSHQVPRREEMVSLQRHPGLVQDAPPPQANYSSL